MPKKVLVVGAGSFIARHLQARAASGIESLSYAAFDDDAIERCDVVVNCAANPLLKGRAYRESDDVDLLVARRAADLGKHFVMLSTRKVYAPKNELATLDETSSTEPADHYGCNKLESETRIAALMDERCTILRVANVYGYEFGRRSFFGLAMTRLVKERKIVLDVSPFVARDFIPVDMLAALLEQTCQRCPPGIYNTGSGQALALGRIAQWLIEGYGRGSMEVTHLDERDAFVMNVAKLRAALDSSDSPYNFEVDIKNLGKRLNDE